MNAVPSPLQQFLQQNGCSGLFEGLKEYMETLDELVACTNDEIKEILDDTKSTSEKGEKKEKLKLKKAIREEKVLIRALKQSFHDGQVREIKRHQNLFLDGTRGFIDEKFEKWLGSTTNKSRVFWLCAGPGMGKSIAMAHLCRKFEENILAVHFCQHNVSETGRTKRILLSLAYQLAQKLPWYRAKACAAAARMKTEDSADITWEMFFSGPFGSMEEAKEQKVVLLIDALDESSGREEHSSIVNVLIRNLKTIPSSCLSIAVSSRPEVDILGAFKGHEPLKIVCEEKENQEDLGKFVGAKLREYKMNGGCVEEAAEIILEKSGGMFLYAKYVFEQLEEKTKTSELTIEDIKGLPDGGLDGYYVTTFRRIFGGKEQKDFKAKFRDHSLKSALQVLVAAQRELTLWELSRMTEMKGVRETAKLLWPLGGLLKTTPRDDRPEELVRLNHKSVRDWLVDKAGKNSMTGEWHDFHLDEKKAHSVVAKFIWEKWLPPYLGMLPLEGKLGDTSVNVELFNEMKTESEKKMAKTILAYSLKYCGAHATSGMDLNVAEKYFTSLFLYELFLRVCPKAIGNLLVQLGIAIRQANDRKNTELVEKLDHWMRWAQPVLLSSLRQDPRCVYPYALQMPSGMDPHKIANSTKDRWVRRIPDSIRVTRTDAFRVLSQQLLQLKGHSDDVFSVGFSPDGKRVVSGSHDKTVRIWDARSGATIHELKGHSGWVFSVGFSPDGKRVVSGSGDKTVRIWDAAKGECMEETTNSKDLSVSTFTTTAADSMRSLATSGNAIAVTSDVKTLDLGVLPFVQTGCFIYETIEVPAEKTPSLDQWVFTEKDIKKGRLLGSGYFADTYHGIIIKTGLHVAIKVPKEKVTASEAKTEMMGMMQVGQQRNVMRFVGIASLGGTQCFVAELCNLGSLDKLHDKYNLREEKKFNCIARDLFLGLMHLHANNLVHRDIACRNLLVKEHKEDWTVVVADFGLTRKHNAGSFYKEQHKNALPWPWLSPEAQFRDKRFSGKSDVWAGGVALWEVWNEGRTPYSDPKTPKELPPSRATQQAIEEGKAKLELPEQNGVPRQVITACLTHDDIKRPTAYGILKLVPGGIGAVRMHGSSEMKAALEPVVVRSNDQKAVSPHRQVVSVRLDEFRDEVEDKREGYDSIAYTIGT